MCVGEAVSTRLRSRSQCLGVTPIRLGVAKARLLAGLAAACLAGVPVSAMEFVRVQGSEFQVCNQPLRFMGFNLRGICHYGRGDALPDSNTSDIATNLDYCLAANSKVIRVFCSYRFIGQVETGNRLQTVLDACEQRGIYVIVAFTDMYDGPNMYPLGDVVYFTNGLLNHAFFSSGYRVNYLPQVLYLANRFRNHPAVFAWQLGNEIRDIGSPATYMAFAQDVATQIRAVDPNHLLSTGLIGWQNAQITYSQAEQLYAIYDFLNSHNYDGANTDDYLLASAINKPYIVDEAGFDCTVYGYHRTTVANSDISKWMGRGARGYMQWALMATWYDNGDGDMIFGVDQQNHLPDFLEYRDLFHQWADAIAAVQQPTSLVVSPLSLSPALIAGRDGNEACTVANTSANSFAFRVTSPSWPAWLTVAPATGTVGCTPVALTVSYHTAGMAPGPYSAQFQVVADGIPGSPQTVSVALTLRRHPGDFDGDNDVDQEDFGRFQACLTGPGVAQTDPTCAGALLDTDSDVDQADLQLFLGCMSGPGIPSAPDCVPQPG